jgi:hypothetical protein
MNGGRSSPEDLPPFIETTTPSLDVRPKPARETSGGSSAGRRRDKSRSSLDGLLLHMSHVLRRGSSPFPAHVGPMPHLASVRPRRGCGGGRAGCGGRLVGLSHGGKRSEGYGCAEAH